MKLSIFITTLGILLFIGCKSGRNYITLTGEIINTDSIHFRPSPNGLNRSKFRNEIFYLYPLSIDSSKLEIRIFKTPDPFDNDNIYKSLFILRQDLNGKWSKFAATAKIQDSNRDSIGLKIVPRNVPISVSNSRLEVVADSLLLFGITKIRDYQSIENYNISTDADDVAVEYVYKGQSRRYELFDPSGNLEIPDAKSILKILNYIESECGFKDFSK